jgi:hypothetical protein
MKATISAIIFLLVSIVLFSQPDKKSALFKTLKQNDSLLFNIGYNQRDITPFENLLSDNFEFYHDQAGLTSTKAAFISNIKEGLFKLNYKPRRELVDSSLEVYPLEKNGIVYGAVQTGMHRFYALEKDKPEYLTSTAKFTHIWMLENGSWKLSRAFSYDHKEPK